MHGKHGENAEKLGIRHPLIDSMAEIMAATTGSRPLIVYPEKCGWGQAYDYGDTRIPPLPDFCKLIHSSPEGAKRCRMCHIMMAVSACCGGAAEQHCHTGTTVLVCPVPTITGEAFAILSSCLFSSADAWEEVCQTGERLGLDLKLLKEAFRRLPQLSEQKLQLLRLTMNAMSQAIQVVLQNKELDKNSHKAPAGPNTSADLTHLLKEAALRRTSPVRTIAAGNEKSLLVHVVCEMMRQRPELPLTVKELAAAARLTPNHFTTLFHEHAGSSFTEYLAAQRIERAKDFLRNPTLSVSEVARLVGYEDPGYFTRRFHQKTKLSPRVWRDRQAGASAPA